MSDGGPAFPKTGAYHADSTGEYDSVDREGMSLRDYFAAAALTGYLTETANPDNSNPAIVAKWCYANADAMLAAREVPHE